MSISSEASASIPIPPIAGAEVVWLTPEESREAFRQDVRRLLGMSADEFLVRLDAGEWAEVIDEPGFADHLHLAMLADTYR